MCWAINKQYGARYFAVMPPNIYGPGDNYHLQQSHVIGGLIRRIHDAKLQGESIVRAWGTGEPRREFLFVDDLADACVFLLNLPKQRLDFLFTEINPPIINVGSGSDLTISSLAETIRTIIGFDGKIDWDNEKPNGTPQKLLSTTLLDNLGWKARINLFDGLTATYKHFLREHT